MNSDGIVTSASSSKTQCPSGCCKATSDSAARVIASSRCVASTRRRSIATSFVCMSFMEGRGVVLVQFPSLDERGPGQRLHQFDKTPEADNRLQGRPQQSRSE